MTTDLVVAVALVVALATLVMAFAVFASVLRR